MSLSTDTSRPFDRLNFPAIDLSADAHATAVIAETLGIIAALCGADVVYLQTAPGTGIWHYPTLLLQDEAKTSIAAMAMKTRSEPHNLLQTIDLTQSKDGFNKYIGTPLFDRHGTVLGTLSFLLAEKENLNATQTQQILTLARQISEQLYWQSIANVRVEIQETTPQDDLALSPGRSDEHYFRQVIEQSPAAMIVFRGREMRIEAVNPPMLELLDQQEDIIGKPLLAAIPELKGQPACELLDQVFHSGEQVIGNDTPVQLMRNGELQTGYFNFTYTPIFEHGKVVGIVDMAVEVTDNVKAALSQKMNEQLLRDSHQALQEKHEKLLAANEQLTSNQTIISRLYQDLSAKEARLQNFLDTVGEGIGITDEQGNIVYTNQRNREIFKVPEADMLKLKNSSEQWDNRRLDGTPMPTEEHPVTIAIRTGAPVANKEFMIRDALNNVIYLRMNARPIKDAAGQVTGAIASFADISDSYLLHQRIKDREETLRMAISSANLGTWHIHAITRVFTPSPRLKDLFGFAIQDEMSYEAAINQIPDSHRDVVNEAVEAALTQGMAFDLEYPVIGYRDKKLRWVKATGQLYAYEGEHTESHFSGTVADITERKLDEQRRNDFIAMVSHELRTPLTSLSGYVQLLQSKARKNGHEYVDDLAGKAIQQVHKMTSMVTGFLDVARTGEGKIQLKPRRFDVTELLASVATDACTMITSHLLSFEPIQTAIVNADFDKIEQVVYNFINNAVKYAPRDTTIRVSCQTQQGAAVIRVHDNGIGIMTQDQDSIFDRFYRVENDTVRTQGGFGIGLYICREIIERHGGKIGVESVFGKGSTFWFSIPLAG